MRQTTWTDQRAASQLEPVQYRISNPQKVSTETGGLSIIELAEVQNKAWACRWILRR